jgi:hypothetical protein
LQAEERHGYVERKSQGYWEAEVIDPISKFVLSHPQGARDAQLIETVLRDAANRLENRHDLLLLTDGKASYEGFFLKYLGVLINPHGKGHAVVCPSLPIASRARQGMSKLSNDAKAGEWFRWRCAWLTGHENSLNTA